MLLEVKSGTYRIEQLKSFREEWMLLAWVGKVLGVLLVFIVFVSLLSLIGQLYVASTSTSPMEWSILQPFLNFSIINSKAWWDVLSAIIGIAFIMVLIIWIALIEPARAKYLLTGGPENQVSDELKRGVFGTVWLVVITFSFNYAVLSLAFGTNAVLPPLLVWLILLAGVIKCVALVYPYSRQKRFLVEDADRRHVVLTADDYESQHVRAMLRTKMVRIDPVLQPAV